MRWSCRGSNPRVEVGNLRTGTTSPTAPRIRRRIDGISEGTRKGLRQLMGRPRRAGDSLEVAASNHRHPSHQREQRNVTRSCAQRRIARSTLVHRRTVPKNTLNIDKKTESEGEEAFNETLKRMLKTPPTPHDSLAPRPDHTKADKNRDRVEKNGDNSTTGS